MKIKYRDQYVHGEFAFKTALSLDRLDGFPSLLPSDAILLKSIGFCLKPGSTAPISTGGATVFGFSLVSKDQSVNSSLLDFEGLLFSRIYSQQTASGAIIPVSDLTHACVHEIPEVFPNIPCLDSPHLAVQADSITASTSIVFQYTIHYDIVTLSTAEIANLI